MADAKNTSGYQQGGEGEDRKLFGGTKWDRDTKGSGS